MSYTKVKYIDTDKTYFTTPAYLTENYEARLDCSINSYVSGNDNNIFGVRENGVASHYNMVVNVAAARSQWTYYCAGSYNDYCGAYTVNHRYNMLINKTTFQYTDIDSQTGNTYTYSGYFNVNSSRYIRVGGCWNYSSKQIDCNNANIRWYGVQFYDNGVLVHNYVPYKDNTTGYGVLYDTITDTYLSANEPSKVTAGPPAFGPDTDILTFTANGNTQTVELFSDSSWTATTTDNWITLSAYSGASGQTISVTAQTNNFDSRTGTVTFTDGANNAVLTVNQSGNTLVPVWKIFINGNRVN